jgi:hypothetical protein
VGSIATDDIAELVKEIRVVFFENCYVLRQFFADPLSATTASLSGRE